MAPRSLFRALGVAAIGVLASCASQPGKAPAADAQAVKAAEPAPPAPPEDPKPPARSVSEVLSVPDKAWVFSFEGSAAYDKAKSGCDERFKEDPGARARCITKARDTFTADAMEFTRDAAGNDVWVIYRTKSNKLIKVYSVQIEYGAQEGDTVSIKKLGRETGKPVLFSGVSEFKVKLGGEYSLELQDSQHGMLSYDARLGFIANQ
ncbi:MAG: hypothetical protein ABI895_09855 [Deltaproteobacteria bacterium]